MSTGGRLVRTFLDAPMPYLVHRHAARGEQIAPLRRHIDGTVRNPVTSRAPEKRDRHGRTLGCEPLAKPMDATTLAAYQRERKRDLGRQRGRPPQPYAELLFCGAERTDAGWPPDRAREWGRACMAWVRLRMPHSPVVEAALHQDETRWHCHVLVMPRAARDGRPRWGMTGVRHDVDGRITGRYRSRMSKSAVRSAASRLQDDVWEHVGKPYGLERGERGSTRRHKALTDAERNDAQEKERQRILARQHIEIAELEDAAALRLQEADRREASHDFAARLREAERREDEADDRMAEAEEAARTQLEEREAQARTKARLCELESRLRLALRWGDEATGASNRAEFSRRRDAMRAALEGDALQALRQSDAPAPPVAANDGAKEREPRRPGGGGR